MTTTADLKVERSRPGVIHIDMSGEIDLDNAAEVERELDELVATTDRVTIDLGGLTYIDSQGVNILADLARRHLEQEFALVLIAPPHSPAVDLLTITGLADVVPVLEVRPEPAPEKSGPEV